MITEVATAQAQALDDWARLWSSEETAGASEVTFLLQRAARMIRATAGIASPVPAPGYVTEPVGTEPLIGQRHGDPAETRTELADG